MGKTIRSNKMEQYIGECQCAGCKFYSRKNGCIVKSKNCCRDTVRRDVIKRTNKRTKGVIAWEEE